MKYDSAKNKERVLKACLKKPNATVAELANAARLSHVTVHKHLAALKKEGVLVRKFVPRGKGKKTAKTDEQRRIDRVVRNAKRREQQNGGRDVIIDYGIRSFSFQATKVG